MLIKKRERILSGKINFENTVIELSNLSGGIYLFSFWENLKQPLRKLMNNKSLNSR